MYAESLCWLLCALPCLFVERYAAPLIISAATFVLLAIPAFAGLLITRKKKSGDNRHDASFDHRLLDEQLSSRLRLAVMSVLLGLRKNRIYRAAR